VFCSGIFGLKQHLANRAALALHRELAAAERLSFDELEALAWRRRRNLVEHAFAQVPFYRRKYEAAGFRPGDLRRPEDFARLPVLEKSELKDHFDELISSDSRPNQRALSTTGGSTGEPVRVLFDRRVKLEAFGWRLLHWWGLRPGCDAAHAYRRTRRGWSELSNTLKWWPTRRVFLDASLLTPASIDAFLADFRRVRPPLLQGYNGALADLATLFVDRNFNPDFLKAVWSTAAPLPLPLRRRMEAAFGCPVYDQYGCGEVFWLAADCARQQGMHIFHGHRTIEVVGPTNDSLPTGEWGDLLVSDLVNRVFPILRYRNGDRGRLLEGACSCGIGLPRMDSVKGRISDTLRLPGGASLSGEYLTTIFDAHPEAVQSFQVHQLSDGAVTLRCVPGRDPRATELIEVVAAGLSARIGKDAPLHVELVASIEHDEGKTRFITSDFQPGQGSRP